MIHKLLKVCFFSSLKITKISQVSFPSTPQISYPRQQKKKQETLEYINSFISSLTICEAKTLRNIAAMEQVKIKNISFSKISNDYDFDTMLSVDGQNSKIPDITLEADIQTNTSHEKLQKLKERTDSLCSVHKLIPGTGVRIKTIWRNKNWE